MNPKPFFHYVLSPLSTLLLICLTEFLYRRGYNISLGLPLMALSLCLFWSGLKANILSAVFITAYGLNNPTWDTTRLVILFLTVWPVAIGGGLLKLWLVESVREAEYHRSRAEQNQVKADFVDSLNGNIETIKEINKELIELASAIPALNKNDILGIINRIQGKAANLAQRVIGWHQLAQEKKDFLKDG